MPISTVRGTKLGSPPKQGEISRRPVQQEIHEVGNLLLRSALRNFREYAGVPAIEAFAVREIGYRETTSAREIANALMSDEAQVSRVIKALLQKKLITRKQDRSHHRRKLISLTEKGKRTFAAVEQIGHWRETRVLRGLSGRELRQFYDTLGKLRANAEGLFDTASLEVDII